MSTILFAAYIMTIFLHVVSVGLYIYVVFKAIRRPDIETSLRTTIVGACSFAILLSMVFSVMQVDWVVRNNHEAVGTEASFIWLIFDYLLVVYLISVGQLFNVVVTWSRSTGRRREPIIPWLTWSR
jgi:hypothetical protein